MVEDEGDGHLDEADAGVVGELSEVFDGVEFALVGGLGEVESFGQPAGAGGGLLAAVFAPAARQPAAGQRAVGQHPHAVALAGGQDVVFDRRTSME